MSLPKLEICLIFSSFLTLYVSSHVAAHPMFAILDINFRFTLGESDQYYNIVKFQKIMMKVVALFKVQLLWSASCFSTWFIMAFLISWSNVYENAVFLSFWFASIVICFVLQFKTIAKISICFLCRQEIFHVDSF